MSEERRNEIFGGAGMKQQILQPQNQTDSTLDDIPVADVPLPSKGLVYPVNSPLYGKQTISIRAITASDEDIISSDVFRKRGTTITEVLRSCILDKSINPVDLLSADRHAIFISLRITSYGSDYTVEVECPECGTKQEHSFDLSNLPVKWLETAPAIEGQNVFDLVLPISKKRAQIKFLTGADEQDMTSAFNNMKKQGFQQNNNVTRILQYSIVSINGTTDKMEISKEIRKMVAGDSRAIRRFVDQHTPGIDLKGDFSCNVCPHQEVIELPMSADFFWPQ